MSREYNNAEGRSKICSFHKSAEDEYLGADMIEKLWTLSIYLYYIVTTQRWWKFCELVF